MEYICNVIGNLSIKDINLELTHMELIDLSSDDFKSSPRLREALRNKEVIPYDPSVHRNASKIKIRNKPQYIEIPRKDNSPITNVYEINELKDSLDKISNRMGQIGDKLDNLIDKIAEDRENFYNNFDRNLTVKCDGEKLDCLINKIDSLLEKGFLVKKDSSGGNGKYKETDKVFEEVPIFIPKLNEDNYTKNIKAEEILAEGADDILQKLRNLKR